MIEVRNLKKTYKITKRIGLFKHNHSMINAINGINLNIKKGQITGLIGMNGAGKTTIIKILSTILSPDEGLVKIDELDLQKDEYEIKQRINMIASGDKGLYWTLTGRENLEYFAGLYQIPRKERKNIIDKLLQFVKLEERADEAVENFSKGMKQRLQIARGLINNPDYLLLDEPTVGLDISIAHILRSKIKELACKFNKGILLTTHYISEIEELCDYVYVIDKGRTLYEGTVTEIVNQIGQYNSKYRIELLEYNSDLRNELELLMKIDDLEIKYEFKEQKHILEINSKQNLTNYLLSFISKYTEVISFYTIKPSLEEVVLKLMECK